MSMEQFLLLERDVRRCVDLSEPPRKYLLLLAELLIETERQGIFSVSAAFCASDLVETLHELLFLFPEHILTFYLTLFQNLKTDGLCDFLMHHSLVHLLEHAQHVALLYAVMKAVCDRVTISNALLLIRDEEGLFFQVMRQGLESDDAMIRTQCSLMILQLLQLHVHQMTTFIFHNFEQCLDALDENDMTGCLDLCQLIAQSLQVTDQKEELLTLLVQHSADQCTLTACLLYTLKSSSHCERIGLILVDHYAHWLVHSPFSVLYSFLLLIQKTSRAFLKERQLYPRHMIESEHLMNALLRQDTPTKNTYNESIVTTMLPFLRHPWPISRAAFSFLQVFLKTASPAPCSLLHDSFILDGFHQYRNEAMAIEPRLLVHLWHYELATPCPGLDEQIPLSGDLGSLLSKVAPFLYFRALASLVRPIPPFISSLSHSQKMMHNDHVLTVVLEHGLVHCGTRAVPHYALDTAGDLSEVRIIKRGHDLIMERVAFLLHDPLAASWLMPMIEQSVKEEFDWLLQVPHDW